MHLPLSFLVGGGGVRGDEGCCFLQCQIPEMCEAQQAVLGSPSTRLLWFMESLRWEAECVPFVDRGED